MTKHAVFFGHASRSGRPWSTMGTAIGETIRLQSPGSSFTYEPGVDAANVQLVSTGRKPHSAIAASMPSMCAAP